MAETKQITVAKLALEDGTVYEGIGLGAVGTTTGEVVFNTSMTGYQEILTDPSYRGQIVTMTYPEIGNYGVNEEDVESHQPHLAGFVIRNLSEIPSNYRSTSDLDSYLKSNNIVAIQGIDTRALVKHIRSQGAMKGAISTETLDDAALVDQAKNSDGLVGRDLVKEVTPDKSSDWKQQPFGLVGSQKRLGRTKRAIAARGRDGFRHETQYRTSFNGSGLPRDDRAFDGNGR